MNVVVAIEGERPKYGRKYMFANLKSAAYGGVCKPRSEEDVTLGCIMSRRG
jgi:hypothetical protein